MVEAPAAAGSPTLLKVYSSSLFSAVSDHEDRRHQGDEGRHQQDRVLEAWSGFIELRAGRVSDRRAHLTASSLARRRTANSGTMSSSDTRNSRTETAEAMPGRLVLTSALKM